MPSNNPSSSQDPSHEQISQRARELWESRGQPAGQDDSIWLEAEQSLRQASSGNTTPGESGQPAASSQPPSRIQRRESGDSRSRSGAETSARQNVRRERDDDPDI